MRTLHRLEEGEEEEGGGAVSVLCIAQAPL